MDFLKEKIETEWNNMATPSNISHGMEGKDDKAGDRIE